MIVLVFFASAVFITASHYFRDEPLGEKVTLDLLDDNSLDVVAFGSSQMQYSFSPEMFKEMSGLNALVMGSGCQNFSVTVAAMNTMFETQSPKYVIVDVFTATQEAYNACYSDAMVYHGSLLTNDNYRIDALKGIKDNNPDNYYDYVFDLSFNHNKWKELTLDDKKESNDDYFFGYVPQAFDGTYDYIPVMVYSDKVVEPSDLIKEYIDQMVDICKQHNSQLVLVKVPADLKDDDQALVRGMLEYGESKGALTANYIDTASDINWFIGRDGDTYHNNIWGAYKVTKAISQLLMEDDPNLTASISDAYLDCHYRKALDALSLSLVNRNDDIYLYMEQIDKLNLNAVLLYKRNKRNIMQESEFSMLEAIGFDATPLANNKSSVQVVNDRGELVFSDTLVDSIKIDNLSIEINDDHIVYAGKPYYFNHDNFVLVVFNPTSKQAVVNSVDTKNQIYFWSSACYEKPCEFVSQ